MDLKYCLFCYCEESSAHLHLNVGMFANCCSQSLSRYEGCDVLSLFAEGNNGNFTPLVLYSLVSSRFSPHIVPHHPHGLHQTGIPHPAIVSPAIKQEPNGELSPAAHA